MGRNYEFINIDWNFIITKKAAIGSFFCYYKFGYSFKDRM